MRPMMESLIRRRNRRYGPRTTHIVKGQRRSATARDLGVPLVTRDQRSPAHAAQGPPGDRLLTAGETELRLAPCRGF